jgi:hypothetical protein
MIQPERIQFWLSDNMMDAWYVQPNDKLGAQQRYSDIAIETTFALGSILGQALRQTESLVNS